MVRRVLRMLPLLDDILTDIYLVQRNSPIKDVQERLNLANPSAHLDVLRLARSSRVGGTCEWINTTEQFQNWQTSDQARLLLVTGRRGTGKTELIMYLLERLRGQEILTEGDSSRIIFFFCSSSDKRRSTDVGVLQGILYHLCKSGRFLQYLVAEYEQYRPPKIDVLDDFAVMWSVIEKCLKDPAAADTAIIIDGLDECDDASRRRLLKCLTWLTQGVNCARSRMILSCRSQRYMPYELMEVAEHLMTTPIAIRADIDLFIDARVGDLVRSIGYSTATKRALKRQLQTKHGDTFLWLETVTKHIRSTEPNEEDVIEHVQGLPRDLQELYDLMLRQSSRERFAETYFLLSLLSVCYRTLSKDEVLAAFHLRSPKWSSTTAMHLRSSEQLFSQCSDLVVVDHATGTVRLFNESVREYLTGDWSAGQSSTVIRLYTLGLLCLLAITPYSALALLWRYPSTFLVFTITLCCLYFYKSWTIGSIDFPRMLILVSLLPGLNGVRLRHHVSTVYAHHWMFRIAFKQLHQEQSLTPQSQVLTKYAREYLHQHAAASLRLTRWLFPWRTKLLCDCPTLLNLWLRQAAASDGSFVPELLNAGGDPNASDYRGWTALKWAIAGNNLTVTQQLLRSGANPDQKDSSGESILMWAIGQAVEGIVYQSIDIHGDEFSALMDAPERATAGMPSLSWPSNQHRSGGKDPRPMFKELIVHSKLLDAVDPQGRTALHRAASMHNWQAVLDLLEAGADADKRDIAGATPLLSMLRAPRSVVVFREINVRQAAPAFLGSFVPPKRRTDAPARSTLHLEDAVTIYDAIMKLFQATRDLDAVDLDGRTAVSYAVENGKLSIVEMLLQGNSSGKPSPSKADFAARSPLMWACCHPRFRTLKFENLNIIDDAHVYLGAICFVDTDLPLHGDPVDADSQHDERQQIVQHLLDLHVEVNHAAHDGQTAVSLAMENDLDQVVRLLFTHGASLENDVSTQPPNNPYGFDIRCEEISATGNAKLRHSLPVKPSFSVAGNSSAFVFDPGNEKAPQDAQVMAGLAQHTPSATFKSIFVSGNSLVMLGSAREAFPSNFGRTHLRTSSGRASFTDVFIAGNARWHCDLDIPTDWTPDFVPSFRHLISLPACTFSDIHMGGSAKVEMGNTLVIRHGAELWAVTSQHPANTFRQIEIVGNARVRSSLFTAMQANGIARWTIVALLGLMQSQREPG